MIARMKNGIAKALRGHSREERELAYLNDAQDLIDLEYRQKQIDRGMFRMQYGQWQ